MTIDESRRILGAIIPNNSARLDGPLYNGSEVVWKPRYATATLEGDFTADELEAIAIYMRDNIDQGE